MSGTGRPGFTLVELLVVIAIIGLLTGLLLGQTLYTTQSEIYRALIEATAFGARAILERLKEYGVPVDRIVCAGGIAEKNPLLMQIYADITGCTMQVSGSSQACALGSAIAAAVLAGAHQDFPEAQKKMTSVQAKSYRPIAANRASNQAKAGAITYTIAPENNTMKPCSITTMLRLKPRTSKATSAPP